MMSDDDGQMIFGDLGGLKLSDICLTGEEKPRKNLPRKLVPIGVRTRARCVTGAHATIWATAVDHHQVNTLVFFCIMFTSMWRMEDMKATLQCHAHISMSDHRGTVTSTLPQH